MNNRIMSALFADETPAFRSPAEPDPGDRVTLRFRAAVGTVSSVTVLLSTPEFSELLPMAKVASDDLFDLFELCFTCGKQKTQYTYVAETAGARYEYSKAGTRILAKDEEPRLLGAFWFMPGFHVPAWTKGAVQYQIFTDRFRNGNPRNSVNNFEYFYVKGHVWHMGWDAPVMDPDIHHFYGGDLQGVVEKLDYLQDLGVQVLYFNPIFVSPSSHKYDTQDYEHVDPHLAVVIDDKRHPMQEWEHHNGYAPEYIRRTTSLRNLNASDRYFAYLCEEAHRRGMRIILDGVFNHCGSFNKWMDAEGIYVSLSEYEKGAYQSPDSPYRSFFRYTGTGPDDYEGWWGHKTLPKLNYEGSEELRETILSVAEKWASPPYSIDGWRLDVAADLGHSPETNHDFWREFRRRVKAVNPELVIIAEHYGDASSWLQGDQWDTVMNYDAFMEPVTWFLTGMEKHSDRYEHHMYQNGRIFFDSMRYNMSRLQAPSLLCAMNQLSNHDHSRFLTRTNRTVGRLLTMGGDAAGQGIDKSVLRAAVAIQMTWPGAPTLYYGDEAGQVGWTDPDCRRTYPWGHEDTELIDLHRELISLRRSYPMFTYGSVKELLADYGLIAYGRFDAQDVAVVVVNNTSEMRTVDIPVRDMGVRDGEVFTLEFACDANGHASHRIRLIVRDGLLTGALTPHNTLILIREPASIRPAGPAPEPAAVEPAAEPETVVAEPDTETTAAESEAPAAEPEPETAVTEPDTETTAAEPEASAVEPETEVVVAEPDTETKAEAIVSEPDTEIAITEPEPVSEVTELDPVTEAPLPEPEIEETSPTPADTEK